MKFLEIFNKIEKGNYALTEEAVYASIQIGDEMIPLYGGNSSHNSTERRVAKKAKTKKGTPITIFNKSGIIISLDGSAGSMTYKNGEEFALNHHAGFITLRDDAKKKVSLEYFALFYQNFYRSLGVSNGSKTLSLQQIYSEEIDLPDYTIQCRIVKRLNFSYCKYLYELIPKYKFLLSRSLSVEYKKYQVQKVLISKCIGYISGNSGLTEESIYKTLQMEGEHYTILSSATEGKNMLGSVIKFELNGKLIKTYTDSEGLLVVRKGKAGLTRYLPKGNYTVNDDAYILYVKPNCAYEIDLKWLRIEYGREFLEFSSSSDNGTWNMTGFFKHTYIDIPDYAEQLKVVEMYNKIEDRLNDLMQLSQRYEELLSKEISV